MECENCNEKLSGKKNFCANCGQKNIDKLNLKYLLGEFLSIYLNFDSKLFRTLKLLIIKPGFLSREYIKGKRVHYVPPIRLYIVLSIIFFFLISFLSFSTLKSGKDNGGAKKSAFNMTKDDGTDILVPVDELKKMEYEGTLNHYIDSITADVNGINGYLIRKAIKSNINQESFKDELLNQVSLFLLLFIPFLALLYAACFKRNKIGFVGHLIFNFHLNSFVILSILLGIVNGHLIGNEKIENALTIFIALLVQIYLIRAIMVFYERSFFVAIYKYLILLFGYVILSIIFFMMVIGASLVAT